MENETPTDDGRSSRRGRLMGKLFGKEKKAVDSAANLDAFLHSSSDNLQVTHPPPPPPPPASSLPKLDTTISRFPQALAVNQKAQANRPIAPGKVDSKSPKPGPRPNKKGLLVRFADSYPEIIGEGGDESEIPVCEIAKNKRFRPPPKSAHRRKPLSGDANIPPQLSKGDSLSSAADDDFVPKPLSRSQTGYSSIYEPESDDEPSQVQPEPSTSRAASTREKTVVPGRASSARYLESTGRHDENRRSFIETQQAHMREAEGKALAQARAARTASQQDGEDGEPPSDPASDSPELSRQITPSSPDIPLKNPPLEYSPASVFSSPASNHQQPAPLPNSVSRQTSVASHYEPPPSTTSTMASFRLQDAVLAATDEALRAFVSRTKHLYELFRLHAETMKPLGSCSLQECARSALWWFLKGRMGLETTIRERARSTSDQMQSERDRQQAYTDLAKGYWLCEEVVPEIAQTKGLAPDPEVIDVGQALVSALKKLSVSMKRNGLLPPEEPFLPQTIDKSIWVEYPPLSQDLVALLSGNWESDLTAAQNPTSNVHLLNALPVGDTPDIFNYGRVNADVFLMEQGRESQRFHFPCLLSMIRPQNQTSPSIVVASQNGDVQLTIQESKRGGPTWDDVRWRNDSCTLEIKLPRGFIVAVQLTQQDYRMLWSMHDFGTKVRGALFPRSGEKVVFRNTLRAFQYVDADPNSRVFPKEPVSMCEVALFEKILREGSPSGPRCWHCGFRIAVATGPQTRTVSGVHHSYSPLYPVSFAFYRGDGNAPTLSLRFESGRQKGRMLFTFSDDDERLRFHSLLAGTSIGNDEGILADVPIKSFVVSQSLREPEGIMPFSRMPWKSARVINDEVDPEQTVLSDKLKMIIEHQYGTVSDRVNVEPGELRMRLEVTNAKVLRLLRQPQKDVTVAVSESQVAKELPRNLSDALQLLNANQTIRSLEFESLEHLHKFQAAVTGYEVIFDALAVTFAIARRRMVVPIHKKWEAGYTRIQVVQQEDKQLQLLAFFEDFHHGHCMNFVLKGTDLYEGISRSSKVGIKFVDAKFPLPRVQMDKEGDYDDMAFVCLDLPDLPGEHDDISILFEKEADRDRLSKCLPAPVKGSKSPLRMK